MNKYKIIKADELHYMEASVMHPANTSFHFSFAHYYDPQKLNFGVLRVLNDDAVKPNAGFGTHPHDNMEIFSYVVDGKLTHKDSVGNHEVLGRGHVQAISAGTGVSHSEMNEQDDWCRFLQIWIVPEQNNLPISYSIKKFNFADRHNKLLQIISDKKNEKTGCLSINQDVNAYVSEITDQNKKLKFNLVEERQAYIFCFEGSLNIAGYPILMEGDSIEVFGDTKLEFSTDSDTAHFIIIEMKKA